MDEQELEKLERLLSQIDGSSIPLKQMTAAPGQDPRVLAELRVLAAVLESTRWPEADAHYTLVELRALVRDRLSAVGQWQMPDHLTQCELCLEAYQLLLDGVADAPEAATQRFSELYQAPAEVAPPRRRLRLPAYLAAAAVIVLLAALGLSVLRGSGGAQVSNGGLMLANGAFLAPGQNIPRGVEAVARAETHTLFRDGSYMIIQRDSRLAFEHTLAGSTTIDLRGGAVLASVTKQKSGHFNVHTDLGQIQVVGTRFSVSYSEQAPAHWEQAAAGGMVVSSSEQPLPGAEPAATTPAESAAADGLTQAAADGVTHVYVRVYAGVVRVLHGDQAVEVLAGQTAVLSGDSTTISVASRK